MGTFADYILKEKDLISKIEIAYYLSKKTSIYLDKSVIFKTIIAKYFIDYMKIDVDENIVLTAMLLCGCKKVYNAQKLERLKTYAKESAIYLESLGFSKKFCKICEEVNRYSGSNPRERESDILELVDQFGGMLLNRPERIGLDTQEALVLLEHRNLKDVFNRFLNSFIDFVKEMEEILISSKGNIKVKAFKGLVKLYNDADSVKEFIKELSSSYIHKVDTAINKHKKMLAKEMFNLETYDSKRALFSEETTKRIMNQMKNEELI